MNEIDTKENFCCGNYFLTWNRNNFYGERIFTRNWPFNWPSTVIVLKRNMVYKMWHKTKFRNVWTIKTESKKLRHILSVLKFAVIEYLILRLTCYEHQLKIFSWSFFMLVIIEFMIVRVIEMFFLSEFVHSSII